MYTPNHHNPSLYYIAWNQSLEAVAECIREKRPFSWIGDAYAILRFIDLLITYKGFMLPY